MYFWPKVSFVVYHILYCDKPLFAQICPPVLHTADDISLCVHFTTVMLHCSHALLQSEIAKLASTLPNLTTGHCILLHTIAGKCVLFHRIASPCILLHSTAEQLIPLSIEVIAVTLQFIFMAIQTFRAVQLQRTSNYASRRDVLC